MTSEITLAFSHSASQPGWDEAKGKKRKENRIDGREPTSQPRQRRGNQLKDRGAELDTAAPETEAHLQSESQDERERDRRSTRCQCPLEKKKPQVRGRGPVGTQPQMHSTETVVQCSTTVRWQKNNRKKGQRHTQRHNLLSAARSKVHEQSKSHDGNVARSKALEECWCWIGRFPSGGLGWRAEEQNQGQTSTGLQHPDSLSKLIDDSHLIKLLAAEMHELGAARDSRIGLACFEAQPNIGTRRADLYSNLLAVLRSLIQLSNSNHSSRVKFRFCQYKCRSKAARNSVWLKLELQRFAKASLVL